MYILSDHFENLSKGVIFLRNVFNATHADDQQFFYHRNSVSRETFLKHAKNRLALFSSDEANK